MKTIQKLTAIVIGGIGAMFGLQSLSGCSEDINAKPVVKLTQEQIGTCCGEDDGSDTYAECIRDYQGNGICASHRDPDPQTYYGPAPVPVPDIHIAACCGDKSNAGYQKCADKFTSYCDGKQFSESMSLEDCIEEYKEANHCEVFEPEYGMPSISDEDIQNCCGEDSQSSDYKECVDEYLNTEVCPNMSSTVYGPAPVPVPDIHIAACCGDKSNAGYQECADKFNTYCDGKQFSESMSLEDCIEEYKEANHCEVFEPEYGMLSVEDCCGPETDSNRYRSCVEFYNQTGECETIYGPPPVPVPDIHIAACCGDKSNAGYQECADKFNTYCDGKQFYESMPVEDCVEEYKQANHCEVFEPEYGMPSISDEDIQNCCGEDSQSSDYKECVEEYLNTEVCPNMSSTVYGMPPLPDA